MTAHHPEEVKKEVKLYVMVFAALGVLTIVTVAVSYLHLNIVMALLVALVVAGLKGSLVAGFFMHLVSERTAVYALLVLTAIFLVALIFLPLLGLFDPVTLPAGP